LIDDAIKNELFQYLGGICKQLECNPLRVGGHKDHVHVLCLLSKKIALMKLLEELKKSSSKWVKSKGKTYSGFYWQNGYGAFSVRKNIKSNMMNDMFGISDFAHTGLRKNYFAF